MTTARLLGAAGLALLVLGVGDGVVWVFPLFLAIVLLAIGELGRRAILAEAVAPFARIGLAAVTGLVSLPLVAIVLHLIRVPIAARPLVLGLAVLTAALGAVALVRERSGRPAADPRLPGALAAVAIPAGLALVVAVGAVYAYVRLPHPPQAGFTSLALNGWAAGIDGPVDVPARGLRVPIRVSSSGEPATTAALRVRVGVRTVNARPLRIAANTTRSVDVYVPAPPDGCLHRIEISLGAASTIFYGTGPKPC